MSTIFGDVKEGQLVLINSYGFLAIQDFNFYQEYDAFLEANPPCINDSEEDGRIIDFLVSLRCVGTLLDEDENPDQYDFSYRIEERVPSYNNILRLKEFQTHALLKLNPYQIAILAYSLDMATSETRTLNYHLGALAEIAKTHVVGVDQYIHFIKMINLPYVQEKQKREIAERGYTISAVFSESGGYNFAYSGGASSKLNHEVVAICRRFDAPVLGRMVECVAAGLINGGEVPSLGSLATAEKLRFVIVDQDIDWLEKHKIYTHAQNVKQVIFADANNILPGEEGYDSVGVDQLLPEHYLTD